MSLLESIKNWLYEPEESEAEKKAKEQEKKEKELAAKKEAARREAAKKEAQAKAAEVNSKQEPKKEPKVEKIEKPVEQVKQAKTETVVIEQPKDKKSETANNFINIDDKVAADKKEGLKTAREAYRPVQVISPIFGNSNKNAYNIGSSSQLEIDDEKAKTSIIGTVFSPINGKETIKQDVIDVVDEKVASMKTSDFIVRNPGTSQTAVNKVEPPKVKEYQPITKSESKKDLENTDTYENLTLF